VHRQGDVVAQSENSAASGDTLKITEIYLSIQGEGTRSGMPCVLVRLTGCDLRCRWCDTEYAFAGGTRRSIDDIVEAVARLECPTVEVTGGEPLLQPAVHPLMTALADRGFEVLLETGGHRDIAAVDPRVVRIVDVKAPGSGEEARNRWENLDVVGARDEVKFVLADRADYEWARDVIRRHDLERRTTVLISAVHGELDARDLVAWMLEDGLTVRFQTQLHKVVWGSETTGV
jgi:7-carboxy-7-deazaguanine synthase